MTDSSHCEGFRLKELGTAYSKNLNLIGHLDNAGDTQEHEVYKFL